MARRSGGHVEGMAAAREALQDLSKRVQTNVGRRSLQASADLLVARLKARTPVSTDPRNKTRGSLRAGTKVAKARSEKGQARVAVLIDDIAAVPIEFGTAKMTARPYIRATVDAARGAAAEALGEAVKAEVDRAVASAAKKKG